MALRDKKELIHPGTITGTEAEEAEAYQEMMDRAERAVQNFAENYDAELTEDLVRLKKHLECDEWADAQHYAYKIKSAAGTMGGPLISTASNFLVHALANREQIPQFEDIVHIQFETLDLIHKEGMKGEDPCGVLR